MKKLFMIHEHSRYTSARDKYWIFRDRVLAWAKYLQMVKQGVEFLDLDFYRECYEMVDGSTTFEEYIHSVVMEPHECIEFQDGDYLVFAEVHNGFARRP